MIGIRFTLPLLLVVLLTACAGTANAPVINKEPHRKIPAETTVKPGDSIYSISWDYGLDFIDIAEWNGLAKPYDLNPGQRLRLRSDAPAPSPVATTRPLPGDDPAAITSSGTLLPDETAGSLAGTQPVAAAKPASSSVPAAGGRLPKSPPASWHWPARGDLVARYSREKGVNGIQIAGPPGSPVVATAAGDVVYAGEGLRGYGKLVILKHSDTHLSAYAHNRRILVTEGDRIRAEQQIAEMGSSGTDRNMLHFEIRVNGKPQDPLKYLKS